MSRKEERKVKPGSLLRIIMNAYLIRNLNFSDINPVDAGHEKCAPSHSYGFSVIKYYLIHYVASGKGVLFKDNKKYSVHSGQAFLIKPNELAKYTADEQHPWEYTWIGFTGNTAKELDKLTEPVFSITSSVFDKIKRCEKYINMREAYLASCIYLLLCEIFESNTNIDIVHTIKNYIDTNYMNSPKISDIAKKVSLDRKYLVRLFKNKTGYTIQEYLIQKKMEAARGFLREGFNVNETAEMTGYSDQASFSRAFKNYFGVVPKNLIYSITSSDKITL